MKRILTKNEKIDSIISTFKRLDNSVRQLNNTDILTLTKALNKVKNIHIEPAKLINNLLILSEKLEHSNNTLDIMEQNKQARESKTQKTYSPKQAGVYIAEKLGRPTPISKMMVNNYINDDKIYSTKKGNRNHINQSELDKFITRYGNDLRRI